MTLAPVRLPQDVSVPEVLEAPASTPQPLDAALQIVGDRWSLAVVAALVAGPQRFNGLAEHLAPIARTVLSDRLRKLEISGIVAKTSYSDAPVRYEYRLTPIGGELARACGVLADWAARHLLGMGHALEHEGCGADVVPSYRCARCGPISPREARSIA
jgi:DNA-binding HxlR family transcriptional regulator